MRLPRAADAHRPVVRADHQRHRAVGDRAAVQQVQRRGDGPGRQHLVHADGFAQVRMRVAGGVAPHQRGELGQVFAAGAGLVHVGGSQQRVIGRHRRAVGHLSVGFADLRQRLDGGIDGLAGQAVFARHHQHAAAAAGAHQFARQHHHGRAGGAAHLHAVGVVRVQAQLFAEQRGQHQVRKGGGVAAQHAVDIGAPQAGLRQRGVGGLGHQVQGRAALVAAEARGGRGQQVGVVEIRHGASRRVRWRGLRRPAPGPVPVRAIRRARSMPPR